MLRQRLFVLIGLRLFSRSVYKRGGFGVRQGPWDIDRLMLYGQRRRMPLARGPTGTSSSGSRRCSWVGYGIRLSRLLLAVVRWSELLRGRALIDNSYWAQLSAQQLQDQ
jgi:hypothetical protein